jgi:hypothetical protein
MDPLPPPLRRRLDQQGSFDMTRPQETEPDPSLRGENFILEEPTISDIRVEALSFYNPLIIDLSMPIIIQVKPYKRQVVSQVAMETNVATSSGSPHIPYMPISKGVFLPPNQPYLVWTTMLLTTSTLSNGLILSMAVIIATFTQSAIGPPFSYRMPGFDTNSVLSYSTL